MKLNLGCGLNRMDGFVNVDVENGFDPDNQDPRTEFYPKFNLIKLKGGPDIWIILEKVI